MERYFHIISVVNALAAFTLLYLMARPRLIALGRQRHLTALMSLHLFRYFGLTALLPGVLNLEQIGFSRGYLAQAAYGDFIAGLLALAAIIAVRMNQPFALPLAWAFNIWGFADFLNAGVRMAPQIQDPNLIGPLGWIVFTFYLPMLMVSHVAIFVLLLRPEKTRVTNEMKTDMMKQQSSHTL